MPHPNFIAKNIFEIVYVKIYVYVKIILQNYIPFLWYSKIISDIPWDAATCHTIYAMP